jgi:hypothetical protein
MLARAAVNPLIEEIKQTFYQDLINLTFDCPDLTIDNIDFKMLEQIKMTILNIIQLQNPRSAAITLPRGQTITDKNCPVMYIPFFSALLALKDKYFSQGNSYESVAADIQRLASAIKQMESFKATFPTARQFILEASGLVDVPHQQAALDTTGVTTQLIRDTFYNEMVNQTFSAVAMHSISYDDLEDREPFLYLALPALTLIEAINQSRDCDGIRLLNDKILTVSNCPKEESFPDLFVPIFSIAKKMQAMSAQEIEVLKLKCMFKDVIIPDELKPYLDSAAVVQFAPVINEIASQISRRGVFKSTVAKVIVFCLGDLKQAQLPRPM